jgi:hypothetical protein
MKSQIYSFISGAFAGVVLTIYALIWTTAIGDGGAWDYWLGVSFAVAGVAFILATAAWMSARSRQNAHR